MCNVEVGAIAHVSNLCRKTSRCRSHQRVLRPHSQLRKGRVLTSLRLPSASNAHATLWAKLRSPLQLHSDVVRSVHSGKYRNFGSPFRLGWGYIGYCCESGKVSEMYHILGGVGVLVFSWLRYTCRCGARTYYGIFIILGDIHSTCPTKVIWLAMAKNKQKKVEPSDPTSTAKAVSLLKETYKPVPKFVPKCPKCWYCHVVRHKRSNSREPFSQRRKSANWANFRATSAHCRKRGKPHRKTREFELIAPLLGAMYWCVFWLGNCRIFRRYS